MAERVTLDGKEYVYDNGRWYNAETFLTPPQMIVRRLERRRAAVVRPDPQPVQATKPKPKPPRTEPPARWGRSFDGLEASDFKRGVSGTTWRRKSTLAGLLASNLSDASGHFFTSHAVYRRPQIFLYVAEHADEDQRQRSAKFYFQLDEEKAHYGFLIEKSDEKMDDKWDWSRFLSALEKDKELQETVAEAMDEHDLQWRVEVLDAQQEEYDRVATVAREEPLVWNEEGETEKVSWSDFVGRLRAIEDNQWCNLWLRATMEKDAAVEAGTGIADPVVAAYRALLPLYEACWR